MTSWLIRGTTRMSRVGKNTRCMYVAWKKHWLDLPEFAWVCLNLRGPHALRGITLYERSITTHIFPVRALLVGLESINSFSEPDTLLIGPSDFRQVYTCNLFCDFLLLSDVIEWTSYKYSDEKSFT